MMFLCMYFIDNKIIKLNFNKFSALKIIIQIYKPIALFRFKYGCYQLLIEDKIYKLVNKYWKKA